VKALAEIRGEVEKACDLLQDPTPAAVDGSALALGRAISELGEWRGAFEGCDKRANRLALEEAARLRTAVRRAGRLLETAAQYHAKWRLALESLCAGYTASGAPAATARSGRLCLRG
jgi:hypothetical protein